MKPFSLLVKPASADCNLRCRYCFYLDRSSLYPGTSCHRMDDATLQRMIATYMDTSQTTCTFGWQGGEPTLMGLPFFRRIVELQARHGCNGARVANGLQTNGTLIDDAFAAFLAEFRFLVGISLDGPASVHDAERRNAGGQGSHAGVLKGIACLRRNRVEFNVLTLVNRSNVGQPEAIYDFLVDRDILFHQYIECVEFDAEGKLQPYAITGDEWGEFLVRLFNRWQMHDTRRVSIRLFDTILARLVDGVSNTCSCSQDCRQYFVVEHNGDVYPCDFAVRAELRLGNVHFETWEQMQANPIYAKFGARKCQWDPRCTACEFLRFCAGDCPKNRFGPSSAVPRSSLCNGWNRFYTHALPRFNELAREIRGERSRVSNRTTDRPGRNETCPCGSGRKFKQCCGKALAR